MTERNSTAPSRSRKPAKPKKPKKDWPLFPHNHGQWAKKVCTKMHFFGVWLDPQKALKRWLDEKDDLLAGRVARCRAGVAGQHLASVQPLARQLLRLHRSQGHARSEYEEILPSSPP